MLQKKAYTYLTFLEDPLQKTYILKNCIIIYMDEQVKFMGKNKLLIPK